MTDFCFLAWVKKKILGMVIPVFYGNITCYIHCSPEFERLKKTENTNKSSWRRKSVLALCIPWLALAVPHILGLLLIKVSSQGAGNPVCKGTARLVFSENIML